MLFPVGPQLLTDGATELINRDRKDQRCDESRCIASDPSHGNAGNRQQADTVNQSLIGLHKDLFVEANPIPVKWAVQQMGLAGPGIRLPLTPLASENHQLVRDAMDKAGAL